MSTANRSAWSDVERSHGEHSKALQVNRFERSGPLARHLLLPLLVDVLVSGEGEPCTAVAWGELPTDDAEVGASAVEAESSPAGEGVVVPALDEPGEVVCLGTVPVVVAMVGEAVLGEVVLGVEVGAAGRAPWRGASGVGVEVAVTTEVVGVVESWLLPMLVA